MRWVPAFAGTTRGRSEDDDFCVSLRENFCNRLPTRERRGGGARTTTSVIVSLRGCAGFPPSRERRGGGARTTTSEPRGRSERRLRWVPAFAGTTRGRSEDDDFCNRLPTREPRGRSERRLRWVPAFAGTTRGRSEDDDFCNRLPTREPRAGVDLRLAPVFRRYYAIALRWGWLKVDIEPK